MIEINKIYNEDCLEGLKKLDDNSINCFVSSPPYWGLRNYGNEKQLGLEDDYNEYINKLRDIFTEVKRVLKEDGTCWVNIGDTCSSGSSNPSPKHSSDNVGINRKVKDIKPKNLIGIPWKLAFALQDSGWYLRQDIIWAKGNPMPESVQDRCTKSHEYLFLLTKSSRYFFDIKAIKEKGIIPAGTKGAKGSKRRSDEFGVNSRPPEYKVYDGFRNKRDVWFINTKPFKEAHFAVMPEALVEPCILAGCPENGIVLDSFMGAGTVGVVAKKLGRNYIGFELNSDYCNIARKRIEQL